MNSYNRVSEFKERNNQTAFYFFHCLPEPHKSNCLNSMKRVDMITCHSILSAIALINWKNGYAPESYYNDLFWAVANGKIKLKYDEPARN